MKASLAIAAGRNLLFAFMGAAEETSPRLKAAKLVEMPASSARRVTMIPSNPLQCLDHPVTCLTGSQWQCTSTGVLARPHLSLLDAESFQKHPFRSSRQRPRPRPGAGDCRRNPEEGR